MTDSALPGTRPSDPIPPDDPTRTLTHTSPDIDESLTHLGVVGDTYTILLSGHDTGVALFLAHGGVLWFEMRSGLLRRGQKLGPIPRCQSLRLGDERRLIGVAERRRSLGAMRDGNADRTEELLLPRR